MLAYLLPEEFVELLPAWNLEVPPIEDLTRFLEFLEARLDAWLGYRYAATDYDETMVSNIDGIIFFRHRPVIEVYEVLERVPTVYNQSETWVKVLASWDQGDIVAVPSVRVRYRCRYQAGHLDIPLIIKDCLLSLLNSYFEGGGKITAASFLSYSNTPIRDLTNVSLPGGLSQTFRVGGGGGPINSGVSRSRGTILDRAFEPLLDLRVRRQTIL
jgi:hypothetical protein